MSKTYLVSTREEFNAVQWSAVGGDVIKLAPGVYRDLFVKNTSFSSNVTITSADLERPAVVERLELHGSKNVTVTGLDFQRVDPLVTKWHFDHLRFDNAQNITVVGNTFKGGVVNDGSSDNGYMNGTAVFADNVSNIIVSNNSFTGVHKAVRLSAGVNLKISDNDIYDYREDGIFVAGSRDVLIERNSIVKPNMFNPDEHPDFMQLVGLKDAVIRDNYMNQADGDWSEGILLGRGGYPSDQVGNVKILNNILYSGHHHGISNFDVPNSTIQNNLVLWNQENSLHRPTIGLYDGAYVGAVVTNNISSGYWHDSYLTSVYRTVWLANTYVDRGSPLDGNHVGYLFNDAMADGTATIDDLTIVSSRLASLNGRYGVDYAAFEFVPRPAQPVDWRPALDFNAVKPAPFVAQDAGVAATVDGGAGLDLSGNAWKMLSGPFTVDGDTWLRFTLKVVNEGELVGVALTRGGQLAQEDIFQLAGRDTWGIQSFRKTGLAGAGEITVELPLGRFHRGDYDGLVFFADDDRDAAGRAVFSDVRLAGPGLDGLLAGIPVLDLPQAIDLGGVAAFAPGDQDFGAAVALGGGQELVVTGNAWKQVMMAEKVGAGAVLSFEFRADRLGEIHAIGLETDDLITEERFFRLAGTQAWGEDDFVIGAGADGWTKVVIPVGLYLRGDIDRLVFVADDDAARQGISSFRDVRLEDGLDLTGGEVRFDARRMADFEPVLQDFGDLEIAEAGALLRVSGNGWKQIGTDVTLTADTVLSFQFRAPTLGEIHAVGFESDGVLSEERFFKLDGAQAWDRQVELGAADAEGWREARIAVGRELSGQEVDRLVFVADDDAAGAGVSEFRNVEWILAG